MNLDQIVKQVIGTPKVVKVPKTHAELVAAVERFTGAPVSPACTDGELRKILKITATTYIDGKMRKTISTPRDPNAKPVYKELRMVDGQMVMAPRVKAVSKYDLLRAALSAGNQTLQNLIDASGFDAKNVRVSISILRARFGMEIVYDRDHKTYSAITE